MKKEALRHPKTLHLCDLLGVDLPTALGYLTLLWDFVEDSAPRGNVGKWPDGAIARACDWTGNSQEFVAALVEAGWLDADPEHRLVVHDWPYHCQAWVRAKLNKIGQRFLPVYRYYPDETAEATRERSREATAEPSPVASSCAPVPNRTEPSAEPNQTEPNQTEPNSTMVGSIEGADDEDHACAWPEAARVANGVVAKLFPIRGPNFALRQQDRALILQAAMLSRTRFSEHWLHDALSAVQRKKPPPKNPIAYFRRCLDTGAAAYGVNLEEAMRAVAVPRRYLKQRDEPAGPTLCESTLQKPP